MKMESELAMRKPKRSTSHCSAHSTGTVLITVIYSTVHVQDALHLNVLPLLDLYQTMYETNYFVGLQKQAEEQQKCACIYYPGQVNFVKNSTASTLGQLNPADAVPGNRRRRNTSVCILQRISLSC